MMCLGAMARVSAPWMSVRRNRNGSERYYWQPRGRDRQAGWATLRLHDRRGMPIADPLEAAAACRELAAIYTAWRKGEPGYGPHMIDRLGQIVAKPAKSKPAKAENPAVQSDLPLPGSIAAIAADYLCSDEFLGLKPSTQNDYRLCLKAMVEKFGPRQWRTLSPRQVKGWIMEKAADRPSMAHQLYRTCRAALNSTRLIYDDADHPGLVPPLQNPFYKLDISLPKAKLIVWPQAAVEAMVALADELGRPSMGDAIVTMAWLGTRRQDWLAWPANIFDTPYLAWETEKTKAPVTIPWSVIPQLRTRIEAAKVRHQATAVRATTFFLDDVGNRPWSAMRFYHAFDALRAELTKRHESFPTRYAIKHYDGDPMRIPTAWLTMRTLRHTCITALHDAGCVREQIRAITGHTIASINEVLDRYTKLTVDQAGAALAKRLEHEGISVGSLTSADVRPAR